MTLILGILIESFGKKIQILIIKLKIYSRSSPSNQLSVSDNLVCCYVDPTSTDVENAEFPRIGRPFIKNRFIKKHW